MGTASTEAAVTANRSLVRAGVAVLPPRILRKRRPRGCPPSPVVPGASGGEQGVAIAPATGPTDHQVVACILGCPAVETREGPSHRMEAPGRDGQNPERSGQGVSTGDVCSLVGKNHLEGVAAEGLGHPPRDQDGRISDADGQGTWTVREEQARRRDRVPGGHLPKRVMYGAAPDGLGPCQDPLHRPATAQQMQGAEAEA